MLLVEIAAGRVVDVVGLYTHRGFVGNTQKTTEFTVQFQALPFLRAGTSPCSRGFNPSHLILRYRGLDRHSRTTSTLVKQTLPFSRATHVFKYSTTGTDSFSKNRCSQARTHPHSHTRLQEVKPAIFQPDCSGMFHWIAEVKHRV